MEKIVLKATKRDVVGKKVGALRRQLEAEVQTQLAEFLQVTPAQIDLQRSIQSLGLGSLHATAIKFQLESKFGLALPPEIFFEDITLAQFISKIAAEPRH